MLEIEICSGQQGSKNHGSLVDGLGGSGGGERKWEAKIHPRELKMIFLHYVRFNMDQIGL